MHCLSRGWSPSPGVASEAARTPAGIILLSGRCFPFQSFGFTLLARSHYHWQLSFSQAERVLLEQLDEDGGCRRRCFRALRQLKEDVWCPGKRPVLTSHHLQVSAAWTRHSHSGGAWVCRW